MKVSYARPSVSTLVFHLYTRTVHPELFRIYAETDICKQVYHAQVRICNAGHTVSFRSSGQTITEVAATSQQPLPKRSRFFEKRLWGTRDESFRFDCGLRYHVSYQLEQLDPEVFLNFHEELLIDCTRADVAHRFPPVNRLAPGPLSLIRTDVGSRSLLIHAFHTFPESNVVVKTQSLFEL